MRAVFSTLVALAASWQLAGAQYSGFNYGSTFTSGAPKQQADFEADFRAAAGLRGAPVGFNSARLYTMVQAGTANDPISAIPAAIATRTSLLFGLWASAGDAAFANELTALRRAAEQYGPALAGLVAGISVGSEDLYRNSPTGKANNENPGAEPDKIADYIRQVRGAVAGTALSGVPIGHVDTWTEWVNVARNRAVIDAVDFLGFDAYPYFETTAPQGNSIEQNKALFDSAVAATHAAAGGKPVWITETGFPVSGKTSGQAVPSVDNARRFWEQVACSVLGRMNVWWYTLRDAAPATPNPSFGILASDGSQLYDLSCPAVGGQQPPTPPQQPSPPTAPTSGGGSSGGPTAGPPLSSASSSSTGVAPPPTTSPPPPLGGGSPGAGSGHFTIQTQTTRPDLPAPTGDGAGAPANPAAPPANGAVVGGGSTSAVAAFAALLGAIFMF